LSNSLNGKGVLITSGERGIGPVIETSLEEGNKVIQTNLTGVFLCSKEAFHYMKEQGGGRIINLFSVAEYLPVPETESMGFPNKSFGFFQKF